MVDDICYANISIKLITPKTCFKFQHNFAPFFQTGQYKLGNTCAFQER